MIEIKIKTIGIMPSGQIKTFNKGKSKSRSRRPKTTDGRQNKRINNLERLILPSIEYKSRDITGLAASITTGSYVNYPMFQLAEGTTAETRVGDKVTLMNHNVTMSLRKADTTNAIRIIWAVCPSDTILTIGNILEYGSYALFGDQVFSSPYRKRANNSEDTYNVLFDKVYNLSGSQGLLVDKYKLKVPKHGKQLKFNGAGSIPPQNYQLFLFGISDSNAGPHPEISYVCRSRYMDL